MNIKCLGILALVTLSSCSYQPPLYDWGTYDSSLSKVFNSGTEPFLVNDEIERLSREIEATAPGKIPPGKTAHLGYLNVTKGDTKTARSLFNQEKLLYPESTVFMDRLVKMIDEREKKGLKK